MKTKEVIAGEKLEAGELVVWAGNVGLLPGTVFKAKQTILDNIAE